MKITEPYFKSIGVLIPTYREAETIGPLVEELREHFPQILVVDDSPLGDSTLSAALSAGADVLGRPPRGRRGLGRRCAWAWPHCVKSAGLSPTSW